MKQKITLFLMVVIFSVFNSNAQTQFWSDTFEDAGAPSSGTRTPENNTGTGSPFTSYFARINNAGINTQFTATGGYLSGEGAKFWAGEDHDGITGATVVGTEEQQIDWTGINVSGKSGLSIRGLFAANNISAAFENANGGLGGSHTDYIIVEYRFNGAGAYTRLFGFFANNNVSPGTNNKSLALDTNGDDVGDGAILNQTFGDFQANITGTGTTIDIRIRAYSNGGNEEWAIDNFRLFETPPCVAPVITAQPPNRSICNNANTTFPITATGATGYQWQVNTGSGFTDITNGGVYSNATTNTLTITGATSGMNGYLYRCVAYNPTIACFTNTNQAILTISTINTSAGSQTNVTCNGGNNGSASITPSGGIAPYTYSWSPSGGTGSTASGLTANSYTVTVTDNIGCTATRNFTITQPPALSLTAASQTNVACFGGNTGAASVNAATGGSPGYTYNWTPGNPTGDGTTTVTGLTSGTWTCTVTDANGCTAVRNFTVTQPPAAVSGTTVVTNVACFGGNTGAINLTPTGGVGPYTFNWTGGITTEDRTTLTAGTYSVTITDANGCTGTVSGITVTQPSAAVSGTTVVTNVACFGGNTGVINLTPTGGVGPYTFNWGGGITTEDRTGLTAGTYSVTITDANGCTGTVSPTVTQPAAAVSGTTVVTNVACFGGNTGAINLTPTGGVGPYTFNWGGGITTEDRTALTAGTYSVTITDANGCTGTVSPTITQPAAAVSGTTVVTNVACFGGNTGEINLTPTGGVGPYTFNWGGGVTTEDRTALTAGSYSVTITDANGCTGTVNATVTQPAAAINGTTVVTNVACFGGNTGAINLTPTGGVGPYTFNWGGGVTTEDRTALTAGTYSVTITDANGCTGTVNATVTQPAVAINGTTVVTNVACFGGNTGAINLTPTGGVGPYTFNWGGGITTEDRTALTAGTYSVTITDANGCTGTVNATVTQPAAAINGTTVVTNVACFGGNTGAINLTPTGGVGPYTFNWGGGVTTEDRTALTAGSYSVTITDANGCTGTVNATVTQPASALNATATAQTNVSCFGGTNGSATVSASGGTPGYTYSWAPSGGTSATASGLAAGTYTVTVTDANGCTDTQSFTITAPSTIVATPSQTNVTCNGGTDGTASVSVSGGVSGYIYSWSPSGGTSATASGLAAGSYTVTITDANTCTTTQNFTITEPAALDPSVSLAGNILTANQSGATYQWFDCSGGTPIVGATSQSFTPSVPGSYSVTITLNTCSVTSGCTLGNEEFELNNKFVIYPNPNNGILNIKSDFEGDFQIVNQLGQKMKSFKVHMNGLNTIDLDNLSDGIYFIRGENQTKITAQKLIIKK